MFITSEIPDEIILLFMNYDVAFRLEKMKTERSKWFHGKTSWFLFFSISFQRNYAEAIPNFFDSLEKLLMPFNHSASNCMKSLLIIFSMSPKVTSG